LALFASRFYDKKESRFQLTRRKKTKKKERKKEKQQMRRTVSNPGEFSHSTLTRDLRATPVRHLSPHAFDPLFLKS